MYLVTESNQSGGVGIETGGTVCLHLNHPGPLPGLQSDVVPVKYQRVILHYLEERRLDKSLPGGR